jgi:hypothetical protein
VHEFFNDQRVVAEVYLLRAIFHNQPDAGTIGVIEVVWEAD